MKALTTVHPGRLPKAPLPVLTLFARKSAADHRSWALPVTAYALVSGLLVSVIAGVVMYWQFQFTAPGMVSTYRILSAVALFILALPLINLASAAARLSTRRKDSRLSGLRLLGASRRTLSALILGEALTQATLGVVIGGGLYALLIPVLGLLHVDGRQIGAGAMVLPVPVILLCWALLILLAGVSSAVGLRRISISPLAVRTRRDVPKMHWLRAVVPVIALVAVVLLWRESLSLPEIGVALVGSAVLFGVPMMAMAFAGPWIVARSGRRMHRKAKSPEHLVAARMILSDPRAAWRQLQSVVLLAFVAVTVGGGLAVMAQTSGQPGVEHLVADMRTGAVLTVLFGFFTVACAVMIDQTAAVADRRDVWRNLDLVGMPFGSVDRVRRMAVTRPMRALLIVALVSAVVVQAPVLGVGLVLSPTSVGAAAVVLGLGILMVPLAVLLTRSSLTTAVREPVGQVL